MDDFPFVAVHRLQHDPLARAQRFVREPRRQTAERLLAAVPVMLDVKHDMDALFGQAVIGRQIRQILV